MTYENLWGIENDSELERLQFTDSIIPIMKDQCEYLKSITNHRVFAKFAKIKMINPVAAPALVLTEIADVLSPLSPKEKVEDDFTDQLADANELYDESRYGFEIYNRSYRFRVFELQMEPVYPISVLLDEGVNDTVQEMLCKFIKQTNENNRYMIDSDELFMDYLRVVLNSKKVQLIIYRMTGK